MTDFLSADYWQQRYESGETGWDIGEVSPPLKAYFDQLTDRSLRILIPGCGNSYEAEYLAQNGFTDVTVIDIAPGPVERLRSVLREHHNEQVKVILGDFFDHAGTYDLIVEQTFFCALDPALRKKYVEKMYSLLAPGGCIAGVMFGVEFDKPGPPFGGTADEYRQLFSPVFEILTLDLCYNSHPKRMGNEVFVRYLKLAN